MTAAELPSSKRSLRQPKGASLQAPRNVPTRAFLRLVLLLTLGTIALLARPEGGQARTFYVSSHGRDNGTGTSPERAWRSIERVNRARLQPGDVVRFEARTVFSDHSLSPRSSGTAAKPITFTSYGEARATISNEQGAVFIPDGVSHLRFAGLRITSGPSSPSSGFSSSMTGSGAKDIRISGCLVFSSGGVGILSKLPTDSGWRIVDSTVRDIGDSGVILFGSRPLVSRTRVEQVGRNSAIPWPKHGIYVKAPYAVIRQSTIRGYPNSGISLRYRGARLEANRISGGEVGVGYFLYDNGFATSVLAGNTITGTKTAGFYYDGSGAEKGAGMMPLEAFDIRRNVFDAAGGVGLSIVNARNAEMSIVGNRFQGLAQWSIFAATPTGRGRYAETRNVFVGAPSFNWNGSVLTFAEYRTSSGAGLHDRVVATPGD